MEGRDVSRDLFWEPSVAEPQKLKVVYVNRVSVSDDTHVRIDLPLPSGVSTITVIVEQDNPEGAVT